MSASALAASSVSARDEGLAAPFAALAPEPLLRHFRARTNVRYFALPDAEETRREKIDAILEGRFEFNGECHMLRQPLDWLRNSSRDLEWHILLHKFYYAVGLGMAYAESAQRRYVDAWVGLTDSWIDQTPPGFIAADVTGRRIQNWIYAYHYFVANDSRAPVCPLFHRKFLLSIEQQVEYLLDHLAPARNHRTLALYAIFLAAVVFPEFRRAGAWREFALRELLENMRADLLPDGVQCELSTDYHNLVLRNYLCARRLAHMNAIGVPTEFDAHLLRALEFTLHVHKPDGVVPSFSDGDARDYRELLRWGHELFDREDMLYVATQGRAGKRPARQAVAFNAAGYYIVRSGWGSPHRDYAQEQYLLFDCGPLGAGNHGHFDCLSFELAAYGRSLIVDPGRYTYSEAGETNWRVHFRGTASHNTVLVDRKNQTRYEPRVIKDASRHTTGSVRHKVTGPAPAHEMRAFVYTPGFSYLHGVAASYEYDAVHERRLLFAFGEYWIVSDELRSASEHRYDLNFHLTEHTHGQVEKENARGTVLVRAPGLVIAQPEDDGTETAIDQGEVSYRYGSKHDAPVVRFTRRARSTLFHSVLLPLAGAAPALSVRELRLIRAHGGAEADGWALCIEIGAGRESVTDYCYIARTPGVSVRVGPFEFDGQYLLARKNAYGEVLATFHDPGAGLREVRDLEWV